MAPPPPASMKVVDVVGKLEGLAAKHAEKLTIALAPILAGLVVLIVSSGAHSAESPTVLSISAGGGHICVVLSNGTIRC